MDVIFPRALANYTSRLWTAMSVPKYQVSFYTIPCGVMYHTKPWKKLPEKYEALLQKKLMQESGGFKY